MGAAAARRDANLFVADAAEDESEGEGEEDEGLSDLERDEAAAASGFIDDGSQRSLGGDALGGDAH